MSSFDGFRDRDLGDIYYRRIYEGVQVRSWISEPLDIEAIRQAMREESWKPLEYQGILGFLKRKLPSLGDRDRTQVLDLFILAESTLLIRLDTYRGTIQRESHEERRKAYRGIIQSLFGIGVLLPQAEVTRRFYLREALDYSYAQERQLELESADVILRWDLLTGAGFFDQAASLFDNPVYEALFEPNEAIFYRAASQFALGNFLDVSSTLEQYSRTTALDSRQRLRQFWVGDRREDHE